MDSLSSKTLHQRKTSLDLAIDFVQEILIRAKKVDDFVEAYTESMSLVKSEAVKNLQASMKYSATNGGKRFRPVLSLLVGELWGASHDRVLPFAAAVEFVHTYSLIHDDLPCMDNDDVRRGKPTNHKVFGEDIALLAGDALLTEAFLILSKNYADTHFLLASLVSLLSEVSGVRGMVGGQAIDLRSTKEKLTVSDLITMHSLKTGALIRGAVEGAAVIAGAHSAELFHIREFGEGLGLAFQVADDILDYGEKGQGDRSFPGVLGLDGAKEYLKEISDKTLVSLRKVVPEAHCLEHLIDFNQTRQV